MLSAAGPVCWRWNRGLRCRRHAMGIIVRHAWGSTSQSRVPKSDLFRPSARARRWPSTQPRRSANFGAHSIFQAALILACTASEVDSRRAAVFHRGWQAVQTEVTAWGIAEGVESWSKAAGAAAAAAAAATPPCCGYGRLHHLHRWKIVKVWAIGRGKRLATAFTCPDVLLLTLDEVRMSSSGERVRNAINTMISMSTG
jgi:hypothetical protein